jgi:hypothetical protein
LFKDAEGSRTIKIPVKERITTLNVKVSPDTEMTIDPEVRLLFRNIQK